jgi:uncharacterized glyoxalase superfamily protein PhnB
MLEPPPRPTFAPQLFYQRPLEAIEWLQTAFGFEPGLVFEGTGESVYCEMTFETGYFMLSSEWRDSDQLGGAAMLSPHSLGGAATATIAVELRDGIDEHCAQARRAGARILQEPEDQFHGARVYKCLDLEGHLWTFSQELNSAIQGLER